MDMEVEEADHWISLRRGCRLYDDSPTTCAGRNFIDAVNVLCHDKSSDNDNFSCFGRTDGATVQRLPKLHVYMYTFDDKLRTVSARCIHRACNECQMDSHLYTLWLPP
jgi:hypothetical protein